MSRENITTFLSSKAFGVVGASNNREKFGNKVLRCYAQNNLLAYPVNPSEAVVEGLSAYKSVLDLPDEVKSISIITPPVITEKIVQDAITKKIKNIWMQPGAESQQAINHCLKNGINVIAGGPCLLVELGFHEAS